MFIIRERSRITLDNGSKELCVIKLDQGVWPLVETKSRALLKSPYDVTLNIRHRSMWYYYTKKSTCKYFEIEDI